MKNITAFMGCLIIAALLIPIAVAFVQAAPKSASLRQLRRALGFPSDVILNAFNDGAHPDGVITRRADAAHSYQHLLVKTGSDASHLALCGAGDLPLGICADQPEAAEDLCNVHLLGAHEGTRLAVGSEAIAADADVYTAASGQLQDTPAVAGTYYKVGRAVTACAAANGLFEMTPCLPVKTTVIANAASLATTQAAMAGGAIVIVL